MAKMALALIAHYIADFLLQSRDMAREKSEKAGVLAAHCSIHLVIMFFIMIGAVGFFRASYIAGFNALVHAAIDWNVWRTFKRHVAKEKQDDYKWWEDSRFWKVVGFDQLLHGLTLVIALALFL